MPLLTAMTEGDKLPNGAKLLRYRSKLVGGTLIGTHRIGGTIEGTVLAEKWDGDYVTWTTSNHDAGSTEWGHYFRPWESEEAKGDYYSR